MNATENDRRFFAGPAQLQALRYLVGVDGGGTGTRVRLATLDGQTLGVGESGPSALGQGIEQAWRHIDEAVAAAALAAGIEVPARGLCALGAGLSGYPLPGAPERFIELNPGYAAVVVANDGFTTVLGAHGGQPGGVVAAGTGTVGEVLRRDGSTACVSGWGWVTGDEGSGAWLGLKAIRHAQQALDGRAVPGPLAFAVWDLTGRTRDSVLAWCAAAGQHGFAQLAPLVFAAAEKHDAVAQGFLREAVAELESLARALDPLSELPLALAGSIAKRLAAEFSGNIRARCVEPQGDSADGALHLVRSALNATMGSR